MGGPVSRALTASRASRVDESIHSELCLCPLGPCQYLLIARLLQPQLSLQQQPCSCHRHLIDTRIMSVWFLPGGFKLNTNKPEIQRCRVLSGSSSQRQRRLSLCFSSCSGHHITLPLNVMGDRGIAGHPSSDVSSVYISRVTLSHTIESVLSTKRGASVIRLIKISPTSKT